MFISKNKKSINSNFDPLKEYDIDEAVGLLKKLKFTFFVNFFSIIFFQSGDRRADYERV